MDTFTWIPDWGLSKKVTPKVNLVRFGDGYEQRSASGLNHKLQVWDLTFSKRTELEIDQIDEFLDTQGAVSAFVWADAVGPYVDPGYFDTGYLDRKFVCREWQRSHDGPNSFSLRATFTEVMG